MPQLWFKRHGKLTLFTIISSRLRMPRKNFAIWRRESQRATWTDSFLLILRSPIYEFRKLWHVIQRLSGSVQVLFILQSHGKFTWNPFVTSGNVIWRHGCHKAEICREASVRNCSQFRRKRNWKQNDSERELFVMKQSMTSLRQTLDLLAITWLLRTLRGRKWCMPK